MPQNRPTRAHLFGLCITTQGAEEWFYDASLEVVARKLAKAFLRGGQASAMRNRDHMVELSDAGTELRSVQTHTVQVGHNQWGATCAVRRETLAFSVYSGAGRQLKVMGVLELGQSLLDKRTAAHIGRLGLGPEYRGWGPVPGIRKWRGGGSGYCRRIHTTPERRLNEMVLWEEGEVPARTARTGSNLPSSWDDVMRHVDHCWKSRGKAAKAWDRPRRQALPTKSY